VSKYDTFHSTTLTRRGMFRLLGGAAGVAAVGALRGPSAFVARAFQASVAGASTV